MSQIARVTVIAVAVAAAFARAAEAQSGTREEPAAFFVPGVVRTTAVFGDDSPKRAQGWGPSVGVQLRSSRAGRSAWVLEGTLHVDPIQNPHYPESFAPVQIQVGRQIGRRIFARSSGGIILQSGSLAPVAGMAIGWERQFKNGLIASPEFMVRAGGAVGIAGWMAGVQVPIGGHLRR